MAGQSGLARMAYAAGASSFQIALNDVKFIFCYEATNPVQGGLTKVASDVKLELSESEVLNGIPKYIG